MKMRCAILILSLAVSATAYAQRRDSLNWGNKERWIYKIGELEKDSVSIDADVYERFQSDLFIGEFQIRHLNSDSLMVDQLHNEGALYLLMKSGSGRLKLIYLDVELKDGKFIYPTHFEQKIIEIRKGKIGMHDSKIEAFSIVEFYKKQFNKLRELF